MGAHSLGTQMEGLHKLAAVAKKKLFVSYENWQRGRQMVSSQFFLCFYLTFSQWGNIYGQYAKKWSKVGWIIVASTAGN